MIMIRDKNHMKIVIITLICLFNLNSIALPNSANGTNVNKNTLAVSSIFGNIDDIDVQNMGKIELALQANLISKKRTVIDLDLFKREVLLDKGRFLFLPLNMNFILSRKGMKKISDKYAILECRAKTEEGKIRKYFAAFSILRDDNNGFDIEVYTSEEWNRYENLHKTSEITGLPRRKHSKPIDAQAIRNSYLQEQSFGWDRGVDVWAYWKTLNASLETGLDEEVFVNDLNFEFPDFVGQAWDFPQQVMDDQEFKRRIIAYYGEKGEEEYAKIINNLLEIRKTILSNEQITLLGENVPQEIRSRWDFALSGYMGQHWFTGITGEHISVFEQILDKRASDSPEKIKEATLYKEKYAASREISDNSKSIPWRLPADYIFVKILEATNFWDNGIDPYIGTKQKGSQAGIKTFLETIDPSYFRNLENQGDQGLEIALGEILEVLLKGNMYSDPTHPAEGEKMGENIINDKKEAVDYLMELRQKTLHGEKTEFHVLHDNVGLELVSILWMVDFLIKNKIVSKVVLHTKSHPYCVSDVTGKVDVDMQLTDMKSQGGQLSNIAQRISSFFDDGSVEVSEPHWFSTMGQKTVDMPKDYYDELAKADFIIAIGDFWYRKMFLYTGWDYSADSKQILDYFPAPTLVVRMVKSPMLAGVSQNTKAKFTEDDSGEWWKSPKYGVLDFIEPISKQLEKIEKLADEVGPTLSPPLIEDKYTLITCDDLYLDGDEYEKDVLEYGSLFNIEKIKPGRPKTIIDRIIDQISSQEMIPENVVVQLPKIFAESKYQAELEKLKEQAPGVRFMIIDIQGLVEEDNRANYRKNIYAIMLLARKINDVIPKDSGLYRLLEFFIGSYVGENKDDIITGYMEAIVDRNIPSIINTILSYKPIEKYDNPSYDRIAAALISA